MKPFIQDSDFTLYVGDVRDVLATLPDASVDCVVTSPPYWGLRDYGTDGQLGLEPTPELFVANMVTVFREVRRVLSPHGTCWVNLGDSYATTPAGSNGFNDGRANRELRLGGLGAHGLKPKDLVGIPWRTALALQADGWYLRSDIIWSKPNPMPESVTDRPTKSHEYVFLLTKQPRYFFDQEAVREPSDRPDLLAKTRNMRKNGGDSVLRNDLGREGIAYCNPAGRNVRSVWEIATQPYAEAHFATYPEALVERCVKAGCPEWVCRTCGKPRERIVERTPAVVLSPASEYGSSCECGPLAADENGRLATKWRRGVVLDPFMGSGTTAKVARRLRRRSIGIELNPDYAALCARRLSQLSLLAEGDAA